MLACRSPRKSKKRHCTKLCHRKSGFTAGRPPDAFGGQSVRRIHRPAESAGHGGRIPITIAPAKLGIADKAYLGFQVQSLTGSSFDPAAVQILRCPWHVSQPEYAIANLAGKTDSVVVAGLVQGNYTLEVSGTVGARSQYQVDVYLVGDVNGDHEVDQGDLDTIRQIYGSAAGDAKYQLAADANLDGRINAMDLRWPRNQTASKPANNLLAQFAGVLDQPGDVGQLSITFLCPPSVPRRILPFRRAGRAAATLILPPSNPQRRRHVGQAGILHGQSTRLDR